MDVKISFKPKYAGSHKVYCTYSIYDNDVKIGEISFIKKKKIFIIGYLKILEYFQRQHYGYHVISYILSHYKTDCIIGQSLYDARGFWNKCIKKFHGQRKNITTCRNCSSSFVIPRYEISSDKMTELLELGCEIG